MDLFLIAAGHQWVYLVFLTLPVGRRIVCKEPAGLLPTVAAFYYVWALGCATNYAVPTFELCFLPTVLSTVFAALKCTTLPTAHQSEPAALLHSSSFCRAAAEPPQEMLAKRTPLHHKATPAAVLFSTQTYFIVYTLPELIIPNCTFRKTVLLYSKFHNTPNEMEHK